VLALAFGTGCVTRSAYDALDARYAKVDRERAALEAQLERLRIERKSLEDQYVEAQESYEDEREMRSTLESNLQKIQREASRLDENLDAERLARMEAAAALAKREAELAKIQSTYDELVSDLESEVSAGQIEIERLREGLRLNVSDEVLFASGSAELDEKGRDVLEKVAAQLISLHDTIQVRGHTDNLKIGGTLAQRYPTNWELAAARAARVVRLLEEKGVDPGRLSAVSLGPNDPVVPNDSAENRARNRRIEILLVPSRVKESKPEA
jgi:chemotaxis protein MotB